MMMTLLMSYNTLPVALSENVHLLTAENFHSVTEGKNVFIKVRSLLLIHEFFGREESIDRSIDRQLFWLATNVYFSP